MLRGCGATTYLMCLCISPIERVRSEGDWWVAAGGGGGCGPTCLVPSALFFVVFFRHTFPFFFPYHGSFLPLAFGRIQPSHI